MELVSIVLPCYNPPQHWQEHIVEFLEGFKKYCPNVELIVVNDGCNLSIDNDIALLHTNVPDFNWLSYAQNRGKGYAIRQGVKIAKGDIIIYTDIDFPYTLESFVKIYDALRFNQCDIAVGVKDSSYYKKVPPFRKLISQTLSRMIRLLIKLQITDTQCGLKGLRKEAKELLISGSIDRYLFDLEFIYRAEKTALRLQTIPVSLREGVVFSKVKWRIMLDELNNFLKILKG
jgi:glycosyltransferase involved in cell wall biosynthesis